MCYVQPASTVFFSLLTRVVFRAVSSVSSSALPQTRVLHQCLIHRSGSSLKRGQLPPTLWCKQGVSENRPLQTALCLSGCHLLLSAGELNPSPPIFLDTAVLHSRRDPSQRLTVECEVCITRDTICLGQSGQITSLEWKRGFNWTRLMSPDVCSAAPRPNWRASLYIDNQRN